MYWEIGEHINSTLLGRERAAYGKRIVTELASQLSWSIPAVELRNVVVARGRGEWEDILTRTVHGKRQSTTGSILRKSTHRM